MEKADLKTLRVRLAKVVATYGGARRVARLAKVSPSTIGRIRKRGFAVCDARVLMSVHAAVVTLEREGAAK